MILIERFIFNRVFGSTVIALAGFTLIALLTQVIRRVNLLTQTTEALTAFLNFALLMIPTVALVVLPFAVLLGAARTLDTMNADSEMHVLEAAGASRWVPAKPIVVLGLLMSLVALAGAVWLEPWTSRKVRDVVTQAQADVIQLAVRSGQFKEISPNLFIQISQELQGGEFAGIVIADGRDPAADTIYYAKRGSVIGVADSRALFLQDGEIDKFPTAGGEVRIVTFTNLTFDFTRADGADRTAIRTAQERTTAELLSPDTADPLYSDRPDLFRRELNRRLSEWLFPLGFGLIAIYFGVGARSNRYERVWRVGASVAVAALLRGVGVLLLSASSAGSVLTPLAFVVPVGTLIVFGWLVARDRGTNRTPGWLASLQSMAASALERRDRKTAAGAGKTS